MVYQQKARERIKDQSRKIKNQCAKGIEANMCEADTRAIVQSVLVESLGWDMFDDVTQEEAVKGGFCDYMVRYEGKPYIVIEVKKVSCRLKESHLQQASHYAQDKGLEWVVLTNGDEWRVYNLSYKKTAGANPEPHLFHVMTTSYTDADVKPQERAEVMYLLSKEACRKDELKEYHDRLRALSPQELAKRVLRKDVIDRIRIGVKNDINYKIDNDELASRIIEIFREEAVPPNASTLIKKLR